MGRQEPAGARTGFGAIVEPELAAALRQTAADHDVQLWHIVEDALRLGLPLIPPVGEALPLFAPVKTRQRGHKRVTVYSDIDLGVADAARAAAAERHAHLWWVVQEALTLGLPLLPPLTRAAALDYDEELRQSA
jgi:hypothetical protein